MFRLPLRCPRNQVIIQTQRRRFHVTSFSDPNFQQYQGMRRETSSKREQQPHQQQPNQNDSNKKKPALFFDSNNYRQGRRPYRQTRRNRRSSQLSNYDHNNTTITSSRTQIEVNNVSSTETTTLEYLQKHVREDSNQFLSLLENTVKLVDRATECTITEMYQQSVEIATTAIEQVEYLEKSLHLAPRELNFKFLLDTVDDCRCRAFSARATANAALGAPREIVDADIKASRNDIEFIHDTRI